MTESKQIRIEQASLRKQILKLITHCECCGDTTKEILQVHHIIPVKKGGTNDANNLIVLCPNCHYKAHRGIISIEELQNFSDNATIQKAINKKKARKKICLSDVDTMIKNKIEFEYFIKSKLAESGLNVSKLALLLESSPQNIAQRLKRCGFDYVEISKIADLLGYDIEWIKR